MGCEQETHGEQSCGGSMVTPGGGRSGAGTAPAGPEALDRIFMALGDRSRRSIVARLAVAGELSVGEASAEVSLSPAGVAKHVKVLEQAGLVRRRLEGRRHLLSLEADHLLLAEDWIDRYRTFWTSSLARLADLAAELEQGEDA
jgi:DNA-binding transcriptional ArsR family regulator